MLLSVRESVSKLRRQGRTVEEVVAASRRTPSTSKWGNTVMTPSFFTRLVYHGVQVLVLVGRSLRRRDTLVRQVAHRAQQYRKYLSPRCPQSSVLS
jgi:hypothetical protein